jgi:hypothetical protein
MDNILEALAVIKGKDATGGAFDAVAAKIQRIARAANALTHSHQPLESRRRTESRRRQCSVQIERRRRPYGQRLCLRSH